jgi:Tfp pilus assembly protein PilV
LRGLRPHLRRDQSGLTIVELLIAMPLMLIVVGGLTLTISTITRWGTQTQEEGTLQTEARAATTRLAAEIRGTFVGDGTAPVISATANTITFDTPDTAATRVSGGTMTSFHLLQVSYRLQSGTLQRRYRSTTNVYPAGPPWTWSGTWSPWVTIVGANSRAIQNTDLFTYFDDSGVQSSPPTPLSFPITDPGGIVAVGLKLKVGTGGTQGTTFTVADTIAIRGEGS